jgi:hypothetical protein
MIRNRSIVASPLNALHMKVSETPKIQVQAEKFSDFG